MTPTSGVNRRCLRHFRSLNIYLVQIDAFLVVKPIKLFVNLVNNLFLLEHYLTGVFVVGPIRFRIDGHDFNVRGLAPL